MQSILGGALGQLTLGITLGLPVAFAAGRLLEAQLFGISGHDPWVIFAGLAVLTASTLIAAWLPARRAASRVAARCGSRK
ncbi:hypothetical protein D3C83_187430 [compost metagenome]